MPKPGKGFRGVVRYLLYGDRKKPHNPDRVAWCETRNLLVDDPEKVPAIMRATAALSKRVKKPVYHYVISWHRDEAPSDELMRQVADTTCEDLGLTEHQALYIAHNDTEHRHVHIVVNRVHPETHRAWKTSNDYRRIEKSLRRQSEEMGRDYIPGRHNDPERFYRERRRRPKDGAYQRSRRLEGSVTFNDINKNLQAAFMAIYHGASGWSQFGDALSALGLRLEAKGQGAVLVGGDREYKLSAFGKEARLKDLQARMGESLTEFRKADATTWELPAEPHRRASLQRVTLAKLLRSEHLIEEAELKRQREHHQNLEDAAWPLATLSKDEKRYGAHLAFAEATASADFAFCLHRMGLVDDNQLAKAVAEREAAASTLANHQAAVDQLVVDATKTLFGSPEERRAASGKRVTKPQKARSNERDDDHDFEPKR
ncbi:relaxase/mobilization nuclease domain-containing protein [Methyloligella solikamskensis]|uniref:Relaxase/mobilization nuclease domain-containing protein n=1 Tax=Methyloligella solikamskensis TaxID=1177756 RepID=A0ABW3J6U1_9HYPH